MGILFYKYDSINPLNLTELEFKLFEHIKQGTSVNPIAISDLSKHWDNFAVYDNVSKMVSNLRKKVSSIGEIRNKRSCGYYFISKD